VTVNYYAHAHRFLLEGPADPYFLAGTAVPDWLNVVDRRIKCRTQHASPFADAADPRLASLARGIAQHHEDDRWFHGTRTFVELSIRFSQQIQSAIGDERDVRAGFLGHILVELLLDDVLIGHCPALLDEYYLAIDATDGPFVAEQVVRMTGRPLPGLAPFISRFVELRFLADYADDAGLCYRINQVLSRVGLPALPSSFAELLPTFRDEVRQRERALLSPHDQCLAPEGADRPRLS
jgi:hypothetical protein